MAKVLKRRQDWLTQNGPCKRCGSSHDLQVHHRDQAQKITHRIWTFSAERRAKELAKCEPICRACHIAMHSLLLRKPHGLGGYRRGCRCDVCRAAIAPQIARQRLKRREELGEQHNWSGEAMPRTQGYSFRDKYEVIHEDE